MKNSNNTIGNRTRDLPVCSAVLQLTAPLRATCYNLYNFRVLRFCIYTYKIGGPGSSVGIATDYGLDGPGSNPGGDEIFRPSRLALGSTQLPVKWVFPGGKVRPGRATDHSPPSSAAVMEE